MENMLKILFFISTLISIQANNINSSTEFSTDLTDESKDFENTNENSDFTTPLSTTTDYEDSTIYIPTEVATTLINTNITTTQGSTTLTSTEDSTTTTSTELPTTTKPPCGTPSAPIRNLNIIPSIYSIYLKWEEPCLNSNEFLYTILLDDKPFYTIYLYYNITNVNACQTYNITVQTKYLGNVIGEVKTHVSTLTTPDPLLVENLKLSYIKNDLNITWNSPDLTKRCIRKYRYEVYGDDLPIFSSTTENNYLLVFTPLLCVHYTYFIQAETVSGSGLWMNISYSNFQPNDPPVIKEGPINIDNFMIKGTVGPFTCGIKQFFVKCSVENNTNIIREGNINGNELIVNITEVLPYTLYTCSGFLTNKYYNSTDSNYITIPTKPKAPDRPTNLNIIQDNETYLDVSWDFPKKWNGIPHSFSLTLISFGPTYCILYRCKNQFKNKTSEVVLNSYENFHQFSSIDYSSKYKISLYAISNGGTSDIKEEYLITNEGEPEPPSDLSYELIYSESKNYNATLIIMWKIPCRMNGNLVGYSIDFLGVRDNFEDDYKTVEIDAIGEKYIFKDLRAQYKYTVNVSANNGIKGKYATLNLLTNAGVPNIPETNYLKSPNSTATLDPTKMALLDIPVDLFDLSMGDILYYGIIIAPVGCEEIPKADLYNIDQWPAVATDDANNKCSNESRAYQTNPKKWNPFIKFSQSVYNYLIGDDPNCTIDINIDFCNRPLKPDTKYSVKIRGFTTAGFTDTSLIYFTTEQYILDQVDLGLIIGLIVGILAIAFIIGTILFIKNGKMNFINWPRVDSVSQISPTPLPVPIKKFDAYYVKMMENQGKIKNEFQLLSTISSDVPLSTKTALLPANKKKNRYINILPYDETRVILSDSTSDYINASYIQGYNGVCEYIATQGPTEGTCPAFWQMILEKNIKLIIMLTQCVESGKDKCYKYFPNLDEEYEFVNDIKVQGLQEELMTIYNQRTFKLTKDNIVKKITHIQFNLWPDFGVPENVGQIIDFCDTIKEIKKKNPGVVVMHCSAGVGRTGTLIAVDILLQTIRDKKKVDIFGTVLNLRKQRMIMVQSEKQYEFLYKCVHYAITTKSEIVIPSRKLNQISESNML